MVSWLLYYGGFNTKKKPVKKIEDDVKFAPAAKANAGRCKNISDDHRRDARLHAQC